MYSTPNNKRQIDSVDMGDKTDSIIEEVKEILLSNGGEYLGDEELKMKICYKIRESVRKYLIKYDINSKTQTELYLFNRSCNNVSHVLCRNKRNEEDFDVIVNEVDNNFLSICEKTQLLNFRQVYNIDYHKIKMGDLTFKIGSMYKEIFSKFLFIEIHNPFNSKFNEIKDFSYDVMSSLFNIQNINQYCIFDSILERLYKEDKLKTNNHWEILQYVHLILKKFKY